MNLLRALGLGSILIGLGLIVYYFFTNNPSNNEAAFLRCPSNFLFDINCPGCGAQRSFYHLLHFEFAQAFRFNALFIIFFPLLVYCLGVWMYNLVFKQQKSIRFLSSNRILLGFLLLILVFGILRNLPFYPFTLLAPPI